MPEANPLELAGLARVAALAAVAAHREAVEREHRALAERDRLIVEAVRSGADLEAISRAASISRAAVSLAARRHLPARPGRGGPYARSRGVRSAVASVADAACRVADARAASKTAKARRDAALKEAVATGTGVRALAAEVGLAPGSISLIVSGRLKATDEHGGAVAS